MENDEKAMRQIIIVNAENGNVYQISGIESGMLVGLLMEAP